MSEIVRRFVYQVERYHLDARHPMLAHACRLARQDLLPDAVARAHLYRLPALIQSQVDKPNLLPRAPTRAELWQDGPPDIELGHLTESPDVRWGMRLLDRPRHALIAGSTGTGKSTLVRSISRGVYQLCKRLGIKISQLIFDFKRDAAKLAEQGPDWEHYCSDDGLRIGLNGPEHMPVDVWVQLATAIIGARQGMVASQICLANMIRFLVEVLNAGTPSPRRWPDFRLLLDVARSGPLELWAAKPDYERTLIQALEGLAQLPLFATSNGLDLERDIIRLGKNAVIELPNVYPPSARLIAVELLLGQLLFGRLHAQHKVDTTEILVLILESDAMVSRESDTYFRDGLAPLAWLLKQGREFGIAVCIELSVLGNASRFVLSNVQYQMLFAQPDAESIAEASRCTLMPRGSEAVIPGLRAGECILREVQAGVSYPMLATCDYLAPNRTPKTSPYDTHPWKPVERLEQRLDVQAALRQKIAEHHRHGLDRIRATTELTRNARDLLDLASVHLYLPVARLWERIDQASPPAQQKAREELQKAKLAEFQELRIGKRNVLLVELSQGGWKFLDKKPPARVGRGSVAHRHFAYWLMLVGERRGLKAFREFELPDSGHAVDCVWQTEAGLHCFEVAITCTKNLASHVQACFASTEPVARVTIVAAQLTIIGRIRRALDAEPALDAVREHIAYDTIETYMNQLPELKP